MFTDQIFIPSVTPKQRSRLVYHAAVNFNLICLTPVITDVQADPEADNETDLVRWHF